MAQSRIVTETVDNNTTVKFFKRIHEVVTDDGVGLIMTQKSPVGKKAKAPVMLVHGLAQNRFSWTLSERSLENYLVAQGYSTFNVELRGHGLSRANGADYPANFEAYLTRDIPALISSIQDISGGKKIFYIGHSLGGAISYCVGAQHQDSLAGIISIGGPFNLAQGNYLVKSLTKLGNLAFKTLRVHKLHPQAFYVDYLGILARHGLFAIDSPLFSKVAFQGWYPRSIERDILVERIVKGFDRTSFNVMKLLIEWGASGKLQGTRGKENFENRIEDLEIPILFINGDRDYIVPPGSVKQGWRMAGTEDKTFLVFGGEEPGLHWGHCDLIFGRRAPDIIWPVMRDWMHDRVS